MAQESDSGNVFKVGLFTLLGLALIGAVTVFVNDKPYWWRTCQLVHINIDDATGLKSKSPVRSLGLEIGYLDSVELTETYVRLGICITAKVQVLDSTRAFIRAEGFLGDKFVELKPVRYIGESTTGGSPIPEGSSPSGYWDVPEFRRGRALARFWDLLVPVAEAAGPTPAASSSAPPTIPLATAPPAQGGDEPAEEARPARRGRDIPVGKQSQDIQHLVSQVDGLVTEMTSLTNGLKQAINPEQLRNTMIQLNKTLENASKTLSPEGSLNTTAQRTLAKLEDAIEQLRDQMTRINRGEGSVGMLLNDPSYANEIRDAIRNVNLLLNKVSLVRFVVNVGGMEINAAQGSRAYGQLEIWPNPTRYYLLGVAVDPFGARTVTNTTTTSGGLTTNTQTTQVQQSGLLWTAMLGKLLWNRLDLSLGLYWGNADISVGMWFGPTGREDKIVFRNDVYSRGNGYPIDDRIWLRVKPLDGILGNLYVDGGVESVHQINGLIGYFYGGGFTFDDNDIKLLFTLK